MQPKSIEPPVRTRNPELPLISVITVSRNAVNHIERCIKSVLDQPYPNVEHIIIDGASSDGTQHILQSYNNEIAYWISEPDSGIYNAMNKGIKRSSGDWVVFLGSDDYLMPGFSEMAYKLTNRKSIYYGCCLWGNVILNRRPYSQKLIPYECICHQGIFYPKLVFDKYQYDETYVASADYYLNIKCWTDRKIDKCYLPILIANFSKGGFSEQYVDVVFKKDFMKILRKHLKFKIFLKFWYSQFKEKKRKTVTA